MMHVSDPAMSSAVEQSIDALCFYSTHVVDIDFRSHAKTALDTIHSLQAEQQQRIDSMYSGSALTPDQVAELLDELYHADAQSVPSSGSGAAGGSAPGAGNNVVDAMSPVTARIFKREMKVRIHEWEASFRTMYGREATPLDKAGLRGIYELYKTVKLRVQQDDEARKVAPTVPTSSSTPTPHMSSTSAVGYTGSENKSNARATQQQHQHNPHRPTSSNATNATSPKASDVNSSTAAQPQPPTHPKPIDPTSPKQHSSSRTGHATSHETSSQQSESVVGGVVNPAPPPQPIAPVPPVQQQQSAPLIADYQALVVEKKSLKRKLHQFEDDFKKQHGRVPTKEDRRLVGKDYHRYGELKALLASHGGD